MTGFPTSPPPDAEYPLKHRQLIQPVFNLSNRFGGFCHRIDLRVLCQLTGLITVNRC